MKQILLITHLIFFVGISYTQDYTEITSYSSPISNREYKIGDSVELGKYSKTKEIYFSNVYQITNIGLRSFNFTIPENETTFLTKFEVAGFRQYTNHMYYKNEVFFELVQTGFPTLYVSIDKALIDKEVVFSKNIEYINNKRWFDAYSIEMYKLKYLNLSNEASMLHLIEKLNPPKFKEWKENEFTYRKEKEEYIKEVDSLRLAYSTTETVYMVVPCFIGKYDFETETFPIIPGNTSDFNYSEIMEPVLSNYQYHFDNFEDFNKIYSNPKDAEFFVLNAEKKYDNPDKLKRVANLIVEAKINNVEIKTYNNQQEFIYKLSIKRVICLDHEMTEYNFVGVNKGK